MLSFRVSLRSSFQNRDFYQKQSGVALVCSKAEAGFTTPSIVPNPIFFSSDDHWVQTQRQERLTLY